MTEFIPGQRWINDAQLQMGLGTVLQTDFRTVTVIFLATNETFVYAKASVPLTRVRFSPGDQIVTLDKIALEVTDTQESEGLLVYTGLDASGNEITIEESNLDNHIQLNRPTERLFHGQIDKDLWFEVRYQTRKLLSELTENSVRGLTGGRVSLIPHQLYIAHEVANRYAPRVLLADEVGLGKTIEAGMILHHQLVTERARRVLIVVPDSLVHQWLVEMLRRFNLEFSVFDLDRYQSMLGEGDAEVADDELDLPELSDVEDRLNPFLSEQLVICSLSTLTSDPDLFKDCSKGEWDLMVVDEAHHLEWEPDNPSLEYALIEHLANAIKGVLLLTATPEQLGKQSHFARLRLLDSARFPDFESFVKEEERYEPVANVVKSFMDGEKVDPASLQLLAPYLDQDILEEISGEGDQAARTSAIERLLDHHGTGRILFRNTRAAVKGFPERQVHTYDLPLPEQYKSVLDLLKGQSLSEMQLLLSPELLFQAFAEQDAHNWVRIDPRVAELIKVIKSIRPEKILVIAASADTALDITEHLRVSEGINAAVFHEGMTLIERDRAAAWFADTITGTQVMVCSEIGSEGRNFQFAHHLFLFDLPLNPDLLEQRIGRLDRIGQQNTVNIHVPFLSNSAQQIMFNWYASGLNAFESTCPTGFQVFNAVHDRLERVLHDVVENPEAVEASVSGLVEDTRALNTDLTEAMQAGRDRLLEFNSCRPETAKALESAAQQFDEQSSLQAYLEGVFDCFGIDYEVHSEGCYAVNASTDMLVTLPQLPEDGLTITYDRDIALSFEDVNFMTWDHPLVVACMDLIVSGELGNTAVLAMPIPGAVRGRILVESIYVLESASSDEVQSARYLPPATIRVFIDQTGQRYDHLPSVVTHNEKIDRVRPEMAKRIIASKATLIGKMIRASTKLADKLAPGILQQAHKKTTRTLSAEVERLQSLIKVNPNVRQSEIDYFESQLQDIRQQLDEASIRLDAVRVVVAT